MSLRHGLLGLLAEGPASGYDLARRFEKELGPIWPAKHPQIYGELNRLADKGWIVAEAEGPRRRKEYRVTEDGRTELHRWLLEKPADQNARVEPLLRALFYWQLSPDELATHLDHEAARWRETARLYQCAADSVDRGERGEGPRINSVRITVEAGVRLYEALAGWAEWAKKQSEG